MILFGMPYFSLLGIVLIKAALFAWLEKTMIWYRAVLFIIAANIFSSIIGLSLSLTPAVPTLILFCLPIIFIISITPAKRFIEFNPWGVLKKWKPIPLALLITGLYFLTFILFGYSQSVIDSSLYLYWLIKFCFVFIALVISIGLTILWEEWVVSKLAKGSYLLNVLKVNLIAFFIIMAILAAFALPRRLQSVDFLI